MGTACVAGVAVDATLCGYSSCHVAPARWRRSTGGIVVARVLAASDTEEGATCSCNSSASTQRHSVCDFFDCTTVTPPPVGVPFQLPPQRRSKRIPDRVGRYPRKRHGYAISCTATNAPAHCGPCESKSGEQRVLSSLRPAQRFERGEEGDAHMCIPLPCTKDDIAEFCLQSNAWLTFVSLNTPPPLLISDHTTQLPSPLLRILIHTTNSLDAPLELPNMTMLFSHTTTSSALSLLRRPFCCPYSSSPERASTIPVACPPRQKWSRFISRWDRH